MRVFCGSGTFCPKIVPSFIFRDGQSSLKMGTFCRKFAEDVLSKDCFVPRTVLSQECLITKFLGRKIHRTFRSGTFRQGTVQYVICGICRIRTRANCVESDALPMSHYIMLMPYLKIKRNNFR
jgi:hypothetical protein